MSKSYSLTEMRNHFAEIVHETEQATMVQVTQRGKPFAFLVSVQEYERLKKNQDQLKE
ncbi:MAG: type II toxin-antitoxin system prevent-host-death family antitoxin [Chloroflexi bacterium]|nr:type II toxin-antitoxin system prevent-host-death family antitoxin [Chloroflexota bacterium]